MPEAYLVDTNFRAVRPLAAPEHTSGNGESNPLYRTHDDSKARRGRANVAQVARLGDVITTPNAALAGEYVELGPSDVLAIVNRLRGEWFGTSRPKHGVTV